MALSEETSICLLFGCIFLALIFRSLTPSANSAPQISEDASEQGPSQPAPLPLPERQLSPEEQRYRLEAQLENQYRDEWAKDFEEQEQERYFREKFVEYEQARQMEEAAQIDQMKQIIRIGQMTGMGGQFQDQGMMQNPMTQAYCQQMTGQPMIGY